ncbi:MAG TPA: 23S rRNA (uracil(747)-C(5))-methyltransferase RlmC [Dermatophilaceae bacterium]|nr:23S rRNA (uracil(747)-C(5))-methyltransferase RlmC [Dermatophilaceae bacterium]
MQCDYFDARRCRSCTLMGTAYERQLADKQARARQALEAVGASPRWLDPQRSRESGFRNKAKLVVAGAVGQPTFGILDGSGRGVDLRECGLHEPGLYAALPHLAEFVADTRLVPYDVPGRRGELKYVIVTHSLIGELMVRFVLRSINQVQAIKSALPQLITALPQTVVVSVNIHPEHKAVLEGEEEIVLTPRHTLPMTVNGVTLHLRPKSFFQTNTEVAASLYRQAREWVNDLQPGSVWDLYCGVGGFALHLAAPGRAVVGVEIAPDAIVSARQSATEAGADVRFVIGDATAYAQEHPAAELIVVNPPRRGLGPDLAATIERSEARHLVYSSCNVDSLARDLAMLESFTVTEARVFDMFPQTHHQEVMLVASRKGRG